MADNKKMLLSVIVPSLTGEMPKSLPTDSRLEVVVVTNVRPVSAARNQGLLKAHGDYIAWVDADDEVTSDWLPEILSALESRPDILSFNARVKWVDSTRREYIVGGGARAKDVMAERINGQLWNKVIKRELFAGISFSGASHEDYKMLCELLPKAKSFKHIDKVLYVYKRGASGLSQHKDIESGRKAVLDLINFYEKSPIEWKDEIGKGVAQRVADFCRNGESSLELRKFLRKMLFSIILDKSLTVRIKMKCLLASFGV